MHSSSLPDSGGVTPWGRPRIVSARSGLPAAMGLGLLGAAFFSVVFVLNHAMALDGGAWEWSASLRYLLSLPAFAVIVALRRGSGGIGPVLDALRAHPGRWVLWSTVGFGVFYAPLCFAAEHAPGWLVASAWQLTIICGVLLAPVLYSDPARRRVPKVAVGLSGLVLLGVALTVIQTPGGVT